MSENQVASDKILLGEINGIYGVQGWVKVFSHTDPRENILSYAPWWLECKGTWRQVQIEDGKLLQGKSVIVKFEEIDDRDVARQLMGCKIWIEKSQMQPLQDTYYWVDLIGCQVENLAQQPIGQVVNLLETGAHDVLRIENEAGEQVLIPFVDEHYIQSVDLDNKCIVVDWSLEDEVSE